MNPPVLPSEKGSVTADISFKQNVNTIISTIGIITTENTVTTASVPSAFFIIAAEAIIIFNPSPTIPPTSGIVDPTVYFAVLKPSPSKALAFIPLRPKKRENTVAKSPIPHFRIVSKNPDKFFNFIFRFKFDTTEIISMKTTVGKKTFLTIEITVFEIKSAAGVTDVAAFSAPHAIVNVIRIG